ncbi:MAG: DUF1800 domain-containing protein [Gemmatimonadota bacterium]|nr:DUF1800 domain-containing protein [Gemmatimonadota bacterium]
MLSRRKFLQVGGVAAAAAAIGCDQLPESIRDPLGFDDDAASGPFRPPASSEIGIVSHALARLSFGAPPGEWQRVRAMHAVEEHAVEHYVAEQLDPDSLRDRRAQRMGRRLESLAAPLGEMYEYKEDFLLGEMTRGAVLRATYSTRQLYEVMVQFWTDHFNIDSSKGDCRWLKAADDRDVIRAHALGKFPAMLRASALSPAMLWYLDGRVNRRNGAGDKPNENYARELMELHTLGVDGGYTQHDVMEVARALTGWTVRSKDGSQLGIETVEFHPELHDDAEKVVLGTRIPAGLGEHDVEAVLDIVALHPSTARHIATKLCRRFIDDEPPAAAVASVAAAFQGSGGDIRSTLRTLTATSAFAESRGAKVKRPFEYVVSALRATNADTDSGPALTAYLSRMGHAPFQYPTPDGYPSAPQPWLGTMLWRWNFAAALSSNRIEGTRVNPASLVRAAGGDDALAAHLLGRRATEEEMLAYHQSGAGVALLLAAPAFMRS